MLLVGLTGGIGSGKSTALEMFAALGATVVDADAVARSVLAPGQPLVSVIVEMFGSDIQSSPGVIDRQRLADLVFSDETQRTRLNEVVHPEVGKAVLQQIAEAPPEAIVIVDVPLLVETKQQEKYEAIVVLETPLDIRMQRLLARGMKESDAQARIAMQASDEERRAVATFVLENDGDQAHLQEQVERIWLDLRQRNTAASV